MKRVLVTVRLVMARTKMATTICRLELQVAVLRVRLGKYVTEALGIPKLRQIYWTDNTVVQCWIRAELSDNQSSLTRRIAEVREFMDDRRI